MHKVCVSAGAHKALPWPTGPNNKQRTALDPWADQHTCRFGPDSRFYDQIRAHPLGVQSRPQSSLRVHARDYGSTCKGPHGWRRAAAMGDLTPLWRHTPRIRPVHLRPPPTLPRAHAAAPEQLLSALAAAAAA